MPNAAEVIERLAGELEIYKLFAMSKGCPTKDDVMREITSLLEKETEETE